MDTDRLSGSELDAAVAERLFGFEIERHINTKTGAPVSVFTVAKELGHGGDAMVRKVYGHLGQVRHRAEAVEYRVEQHAAKLGGRLVTLRRSSFWHRSVTTGLERTLDAVSCGGHWGL